MSAPSLFVIALSFVATFLLALLLMLVFRDARPWIFAGGEVFAAGMLAWWWFDKRRRQG